MYIFSNLNTNFECNKFFSKIPAYLKVVDKYPADYTLCRFRALSSGLPIPAAGSQQPAPEINVSLGWFYAD